VTARLVPASDAALEAAAQALSAAPVDPPGVRDHAWLHAEPAEALRRLQRARDHRIEHGGLAWVVLADEVAVGYVSARIYDDGHRAETFSVVARVNQGLGVGLESRRLALEALAAAGVRSVVSLARPDSASAAISRKLGYELSGAETRAHPDGFRVELERYELQLKA